MTVALERREDGQGDLLVEELEGAGLVRVAEGFRQAHVEAVRFGETILLGGRLEDAALRLEVFLSATSEHLLRRKFSALTLGLVPTPEQTLDVLLEKGVEVVVAVELADVLDA